MKKYLKEIVSILLQIFIFYLFPKTIGNIGALGMVFLILSSTFILSIIVGCISKNKIKYFYPILVSLLFIPSIFIYYNESAFIHSLWYLIVSSLGILIGTVINKLQKIKINKKIVLTVIIVVSIILLFPIPMFLNDGGSIEFRAKLYKVTKYHKLAPVNSEIQYIDGIGIEILGVEIFNNTNKVIADKDAVKYNSFVGTVLEETTTYMIVEPNEDEVERKSSDKIVINYRTDHRDYLYGIGRKVIINYTGYIKETYPAQIDTDNILINGYEEFEISVKESNNKKKIKILNNTELHKYNSDFDLYYYGLEEVNILVDNKTISLEAALRSGKMTIDSILAKANQDVTNGTIKEGRYKDGGSVEFYYDTYTIIKCHSLDGNRDVYIGIPEMKLNSVK